MKSIKQRLADGETVVVFALSRIFHPNLVEMYAVHGGFHGFWLDDEHRGFTTAEMEQAASAGRSAGLDGFVRLAPTGYAPVMRCFESGFSGVMAAKIDTPEQALRFRDWAKFPPLGDRGLNSGGFDGRFGNTPLPEFCRRANENTFVAIQIETVASVDCCDEIAAIDGVDQLFIGPADLSLALGVTGEFLHPKCLAAIDRVMAACERHGKSVGAVTTSPEHANMLLDKGCRLISPTNDVRTFNAGVQSVRRTFERIFSK